MHIILSRRWLVRGLLKTIVATALILFMATASSYAGGKVKIGVVDCYSGPATVYTYDARDGFKLALKEAGNKVLGKEIEVYYRDTKFRPNLALTFARELILKNHVDFLAGTINSAGALAVSSLCKNKKIPFFVWEAQSEKITGAKGHRYVFSFVPNTAMSGRALALYAAQRGFKRYWITGSDYEYGHAIANSFWKNLKELNPSTKLIGQSWFKVGEPDLGPYISAIMAAKPDAVLVATGGRDMIPFLKATRATGLAKKTTVIVWTATDTSTLRALGMRAPEGVYGGCSYHFYFPKTPENLTFASKFKKAYGREPGFCALAGYLCGKFFIEAAKKAGSTDREKIIDAMEGLTIDSPVGKVTMRAYDHQIMQPIFVGKIAKVPGYKFPIATEIETISAKYAIPPIEKIKKARESGK